MNTSQYCVEPVFERSVQLTAALCADYISANPFVHQFYIRQLTHVPKAADYLRCYQSGINFNILLYCTSGSGWCQIGDKLHQLGPNQCMIITPTQQAVAYGVSQQDTWGFYKVVFGGEHMVDFCLSFKLDCLNKPLDVGVHTQAIEIWEEMYALLQQGLSKRQVANANFCLNHFIGAFVFPPTTSQNEYGRSSIDETIAYMKEMIQEKLTVEELAERLQLSVSYFSSLFRKSTGMAPLEYFIQLKLKRACYLLTEKGLKVKEVADAMGYEDPFHFSRLFKKHMRVSPIAYKVSRNPGAASKGRISRTLSFEPHAAVMVG